MESHLKIHLTVYDIHYFMFGEDSRIFLKFNEVERYTLGRQKATYIRKAEGHIH